MTPAISLLQKLGVYVDEQFLSEEECSELQELMLTAKKFEAGVHKKGKKNQQSDTTVRTTQYCDIPYQSHQKICNRIYALKNRFEELFQSKYSEVIEPPKYLCYQPGDFFAQHTDTGQNRRINISVYLNNQIEESEEDKKGIQQTKNISYSGGELKLYGLIKSCGWEKRGITVPGKAGTLVAYPVDLVHEVTPILSGARFAIVSRFLSHSPDNS